MKQVRFTQYIKECRHRSVYTGKEGSYGGALWGKLRTRRIRVDFVDEKEV